MRGQSHRSVAWGALIATSLTMSVGCTNKDAKGGSSEAIIGQGEVDLATASPPEMAVRFDQMSPDAFQAYTRGLKYALVKHVHRKCKNDPQRCSQSTDSARIAMSPVKGLRRLGKVKNGGIVLPGKTSHSYVIAKIVNDSDYAVEYWLKLAPGDSVFWLLEPDDHGYAQSRFVQLEPGANGTVIKQALPGFEDALPYISCKHKRRRSDQVNFANCQNDYGVAGAQPQGRSQPLESNGDVTSTWASCPGGCCATSNGTRCKSGQPCADSIKTSSARPAPGSPGT